MSDPVESVVFVLTSGEYSDYRVHCVVRGGREEAARLAERANATGSEWCDDYEVRELSVVDADVQRFEVLTLRAEIHDDGRVRDFEPRLEIGWPFTADPSPLTWSWTRGPGSVTWRGTLTVSGTDHERVRKVFGDRRAMLMADDAERAKRKAGGKLEA